MTKPPSQVLVCLTTVTSAADAEVLARSLVDRRLAACVQIDGPIRSHYRWEGKHCCSEEFRLTIKTRRGQEVELRECLRELHAYDEPQIVTLQSVDVDPGYARWVEKQTIAAPDTDV